MVRNALNRWGLVRAVPYLKTGTLRLFWNSRYWFLSCSSLHFLFWENGASSPEGPFVLLSSFSFFFWDFTTEKVAFSELLENMFILTCECAGILSRTTLREREFESKPIGERDIGRTKKSY